MLRKIDSDWLPEYKCHGNNQSEMLLEVDLMGLKTKLGDI